MRTPAVGAILMLVFATACAHHRAVPLEVGRELHAEREREFLAALATRDADSVAAFFADDAVLHIASMPPIEGAAIHRLYQNLSSFLVRSDARPEGSYVSATGDMAYSIGRTSNEFRTPEGSVVHSGKYSLLWRRVGDDWLVVLYSVSSNQADAPR